MLQTPHHSRVEGLHDPQLRSLLPLLYVASVDLALSETERQALRKKVASMPWLRPAARQAVEAWLDPQKPPHELEFKALTKLLAGIAKTTDSRARATFHALASELATTPESHSAVDE